MSRKSPPQEVKQELSLSEAAANLIEECRMLLPGIQALFGFQLIAVFNSLFAEKRLMLFSMAPLAISICLELYLISRLILHDTLLSLLITLGLLSLFILLWFVLPHSEALKQVLAGKS